MARVALEKLQNAKVVKQLNSLSNIGRRTVLGLDVSFNIDKEIVKSIALGETPYQCFASFELVGFSYQTTVCRVSVRPDHYGFWSPGKDVEMHIVLNAFFNDCDFRDADHAFDIAGRAILAGEIRQYLFWRTRLSPASSFYYNRMKLNSRFELVYNELSESELEFEVRGAGIPFASKCFKYTDFVHDGDVDGTPVIEWLEMVPCMSKLEIECLLKPDHDLRPRQRKHHA